MRAREKKYKETSPLEFLLLRDRWGLSRYRKSRRRDPLKLKILTKLALEKMEKKEKDDFILVEYRRRKLKLL